MKNLRFAVITAFALIIFGACTPEQPQSCPDGSLAVRAYSNVCGCYTWVCPTPPPTNGCNTCGGGGNTGGGTGGGVTSYNFIGSVYETALLTSISVQPATALTPEGQIVKESSGALMTAPKLYAIGIHPWNGTNFVPSANDGQGLITNFQTAGSKGLYNRMLEDLDKVGRSAVIQNTLNYFNTGAWDPGYYYIVVTLRKNANGSPVGRTATGTPLMKEITSYEIVRGMNNYFYYQ